MCLIYVNLHMNPVLRIKMSGLIKYQLSFMLIIVLTIILCSVSNCQVIIFITHLITNSFIMIMAIENYYNYNIKMVIYALKI